MVFAFFKKRLKGAELPHPEISTSIFLVVEEAICIAWNLMRTKPRVGFNVLNAAENTITHELRVRLLDEVFNKGIVKGFDRQLFTNIVRDSKVCNFDGSNLDKMPDLLISLYDRNVYKPSQDGLFVECKPVDSNHSVGVHYCDKGIIRFVCGDYAWAMTNALMIGYVRNGYSIPSKLTKALKDDKTEVRTTTLPSPCKRSKPGKNNEVVYLSQHPRTFSYVETGQQASAITLRHLWLRRD